MASFDINFQANTSGKHYIGWRTYGMTANTYTVVIVNVIIPGAQTTTIDVPGNLYCADANITYTGYVVAGCQLQAESVLETTSLPDVVDDGAGDGIPDLALQWTVEMLQQTDPCIKTQITCDNVGVDTIGMTAFGLDYTSPPTVTIGAPDLGGGVQAEATASLGALGALSSVVITPTASTYNDGVFNNVGFARTGQVATTGSGALATVTIVGGAITDVTITAGGSGYDATDLANLTLANNCNTIGNSGTVTALTLNPTVGTGYIQTISYPPSGGSGQDLVVSWTVSGGDINSVGIVDGGCGYLVGDVVALNATGSSNDETVTIDTVSTLTEGTLTGTTSNSVSAIIVTVPGTGYQSIPTVSISGGGGTGATATAVLGNCPVLDLGTYKCASQLDLSDTPDHVLALGDSAVICANVATLSGLTSQFVDTPVIDVSPTGNCHCESCAQVTVNVPGGASGSGKITYQTCWDTSNGLGSVTMVSQTVNYNQTVNLGCIIEGTLVIDQGNLLGGQLSILSSIACP